MKTKTIFYCSNCGAQSLKWIGKCPSCGEWNTYIEEVVERDKNNNWQKQTEKIIYSPKKISEISIAGECRINSNNQEFNRVLGGGLVLGSLILLGGEPGIGKSTLLLQIALNIKNRKVLYVSGEESEQQIKLRAERIGIKNENCYILTETLTKNILDHSKKIVPELLIIDSIQTLQTPAIDSTAGSISQIKESAAEMQYFAKNSSIPVILVGHITKDGSIAGPKLLEHMVDTVLQFEGDRNYGYRIIRSIKNRFGSTSELGIYQMHGNGLREVTNPSEILLSQRDDSLSGIAIAATIEGLRPMLIETQALVSSAAYGTPQRSANGFDSKRLNMLLAVLEKRHGFRLGIKDVFMNIAGGIRVDDPAIDLAVICSILSSNENIAINSNYCFAAEVGLSGEIRPVTRIEQRISEANKLGFEKIFISKYNIKETEKIKVNIEVIPIQNVEQLFDVLFR